LINHLAEVSQLID